MPDETFGAGALEFGGVMSARVGLLLSSAVCSLGKYARADGSHVGGAVFVCGDDSHGQLGLDRGRPTCLEPTQPKKFDRGGVRVIGASCGGAHTAFLLRAVVDA